MKCINLVDDDKFNLEIPSALDITTVKKKIQVEKTKSQKKGAEIPEVISINISRSIPLICIKEYVEFVAARFLIKAVLPP
eukprot:snap_masked-scaffold_3-processed-gene-1.21-mRNA-1 protein AED:1.00 eAED:1.00 QI:0/-1/0/0/-1/1/1/0/79